MQATLMQVRGCRHDPQHLANYLCLCIVCCLTVHSGRVRVTRWFRNAAGADAKAGAVVEPLPSSHSKWTHTVNSGSQRDGFIRPDDLAAYRYPQPTDVQVEIVLNAGEYFGEEALVAKATEPVIMAAVAESHCFLYTLDKQDFYDVISEFPEYANVLKVRAVWGVSPCV